MRGWQRAARARQSAEEAGATVFESKRVPRSANTRTNAPRGGKETQLVATRLVDELALSTVLVSEVTERQRAAAVAPLIRPRRPHNLSRGVLLLGQCDEGAAAERSTYVCLTDFVDTNPRTGADRERFRARAEGEVYLERLSCEEHRGNLWGGSSSKVGAGKRVVR